MWSVGRSGRWFPNFVCGMVTAELWSRSRLFEWWMVCGRLDSLSAAGSQCGPRSRRPWLMRFLLPSFSTFSPPLYRISSNFFLCTRWAEAHSRRSVTHSAGSENMHTWARTLNSQPTCAETFYRRSETSHCLFWRVFFSEMVSALSSEILNHFICTVTVLLFNHWRSIQFICSRWVSLKALNNLWNWT